MKAEKKMKLLKQAWKEVFDVDEVKDDADFFEEGGDSIKAVQLSSWLIQKGLKLDLGKIFYTPVLSDMAKTLEETDAVYVPAELMTKELMQKKYEEIMNEEKPDKETGDSEENNQAGEAAEGQQICDPAIEGTAGDQQICDPAGMKMPGVTAGDQQICDPAIGGTAEGQQICDPAGMKMPGVTAGDQQTCDPAGMKMKREKPGMNTEKMMRSMLKLMISQQQTMLQMMEMMADFLMPESEDTFVPGKEPPAVPKFPLKPPFPFPAGGNVPNPQTMISAMMQKVPKDKIEKFAKIWQSYQSKKVNKPIEKPTVMKLREPKVTTPTQSAEEVLTHVLSGILKKDIQKTEDLFEQGITSLDTVKIVTRCGEHGYRLKMQDIYMHSTFEELVKCMTPGE